MRCRLLNHSWWMYGLRNPDAADRYVVDDFVITSAGKEIRSMASFKQWIREFQAEAADLEFEAIESFQNAEGSRVVSRWRIRGHNNGVFGPPPDQRPLEMTGTSVWAVRADGQPSCEEATERLGVLSASSQSVGKSFESAGQNRENVTLWHFVTCKLSPIFNGLARSEEQHGISL